ncbi:MAG: hypothetical protein JWM19_4311 [Actinomycetia bacterium]|nr:hypothetical protein [Actinomycetes bacterium]
MGELAVAGQRVLVPVMLQAFRQRGVKVLDRLVKAGVEDRDPGRAIGRRHRVLVARRRRLRVGLRPAVVLVLTGEHVVRPDARRRLIVLVLPQAGDQARDVHALRDLERQDWQPGLAEASGKLLMRRRAHLAQPPYCRTGERLLVLHEDVARPVQVPGSPQHRGMPGGTAPPCVAVQVVACPAALAHSSPVLSWSVSPPSGGEPRLNTLIHAVLEKPMLWRNPQPDRPDSHTL